MTSMFNQATSNEDEECLFAMQLASASVVPMVLKAVIEMDILEIIAKAGPGAQLSLSHIVSKLPTQNPDAPIMLNRILLLLAGYSILTCSLVNRKDGLVERLYGLAPVCKFLVKNQDNVSMAPMVLLFQEKVFMESWYYLKDAVIDGVVPFNKAYGRSVFEYCRTDPRLNKVFNRAMSDRSTLIMKKILDTYKGFEGVNVLVDVGGGTGQVLNLIVSNYPHIKAMNFDLPHAIADAPAYPGVEHVGGDMFVSVPSADAIFMKSILHDWSDEHCIRILKNCHKALPESGKVIVVESALLQEVGSETSVAANVFFQIDIIMLANTSGGKERTHKELEELAKGSGFSGFRALCCAYGDWIMEFYK